MRIGLDVARLHLACRRLHGVALLYSVPRIECNKCRLQRFVVSDSQTMDEIETNLPIVHTSDLEP